MFSTDDESSFRYDSGGDTTALVSNALPKPSQSALMHDSWLSPPRRTSSFGGSKILTRMQEVQGKRLFENIERGSAMFAVPARCTPELAVEKSTAADYLSNQIQEIIGLRRNGKDLKTPGSHALTLSTFSLSFQTVPRNFTTAESRAVRVSNGTKPPDTAAQPSERNSFCFVNLERARHGPDVFSRPYTLMGEALEKSARGIEAAEVAEQQGEGRRPEEGAFSASPSPSDDDAVACTAQTSQSSVYSAKHILNVKELLAFTRRDFIEVRRKFRDRFLLSSSATARDWLLDECDPTGTLLLRELSVERGTLLPYSNRSHGDRREGTLHDATSATRTREEPDGRGAPWERGPAPPRESHSSACTPNYAVGTRGRSGSLLTRSEERDAARKRKPRKDVDGVAEAADHRLAALQVRAREAEAQLALCVGALAEQRSRNRNLEEACRRSCTMLRDMQRTVAKTMASLSSLETGCARLVAGDT